MAKKIAITFVVLYLLCGIGVAISALSMNWNADWPLQHQIAEAVKAGVSWPMAVTELLASN